MKWFKLTEEEKMTWTFNPWMSKGIITAVIVFLIYSIGAKGLSGIIGASICLGIFGLTFWAIKWGLILFFRVLPDMNHPLIEKKEEL